ncbi:MAG: MGMT family protein [Bacteroidota bacterium]
MGAVTTYQDIARSIQNPNALQAVGSAIGSNHIAYLIPCPPCDPERRYTW